MPDEEAFSSDSFVQPAERIAPDRRDELPLREPGLCLSGGGYRAMLYHAGVLWALNDLGWLPRFGRISSVSGGSITAGVLAARWDQFQFNSHGIAANFPQEIVDPIRGLGSESIDVKSGLAGLFLPGSISDRIQRQYEKHLFGEVTLNELPKTGPRFVFNASSLQSAALWRFSRPYMADWRVGLVPDPGVRLSKAVAASSAFPPFLSPAILQLDSKQFRAGSGDDLEKSPYTEKAVLSDGGVYDNLGLETVYKKYETVIVSDAGGQIEPDPTPPRDWARQSLRVLSVIDNQVRSLRKRNLIAAYIRRRELLANGVPENDPHLQMWSRLGTYFSIRGEASDYLRSGEQLSMALPHQKTFQLAAVPTRLKSLPDETQEQLINWGYAMTRLAMRRWVDKTLPGLANLPYSATGVG